MADLHIIKFRLSTPGLWELARKRLGPSGTRVDLGYIVHCALGELFKDSAPSPFTVTEEGRSTEVMAYSMTDPTQLKDSFCVNDWAGASRLTEPGSFSTKVVPQIEVGRQLILRAKVCPVVRTRTELPDPKGGPRFKKGAELDVWLARKLQTAEAGNPVPSRDDAYREWVGEETERRGGLSVHSTNIISWQTVLVGRRSMQSPAGTQTRKLRLFSRPELTFESLVTVTGDVQALLARGLGRHRGFGMGMALVRRAR